MKDFVCVCVLVQIISYHLHFRLCFAISSELTLGGSEGRSHRHYPVCATLCSETSPIDFVSSNWEQRKQRLIKWIPRFRSPMLIRFKWSVRGTRLWTWVFGGWFFWTYFYSFFALTWVRQHMWFLGVLFFWSTPHTFFSPNRQYQVQGVAQEEESVEQRESGTAHHTAAHPHPDADPCPHPHRGCWCSWGCCRHTGEAPSPRQTLYAL